MIAAVVRIDVTAAAAVVAAAGVAASAPAVPPGVLGQERGRSEQHESRHNQERPQPCADIMGTSHRAPASGIVIEQKGGHRVYIGSPLNRLHLNDFGAAASNGQLRP
jgi:hypothetical protein